MKFLSILLLLIAVFCPGIQAQYEEFISTDRLGNSIRANTVGKRTLQIESGINLIRWTNELNNYPDEIYKTNIVDNQIRYGLNNRLELSGLIQYRKDEFFGHSFGPNEYNGIGDLRLGLKIKGSAQKGFLPAWSFKGEVLPDLISAGHKNNALGFNLIFATESRIDEIFLLTTNWSGLVFLDRTLDFTRGLYFNYSLNLSANVSKRIIPFVEIYGPINEFSYFLNTGVNIIILKNLVFDFSGAFKVRHSNSRNWFLKSGLSVRIGGKKELSNNRRE